MNPCETVIVIRSLVPGGVAQQDGRLIPGDRLLFVNEINLENASLDVAVQVLKGAPKGIVQIGVAKPLPLPDSNSQVSDSSSKREHVSSHHYVCQANVIKPPKRNGSSVIAKNTFPHLEPDQF